MRIVSKKYNGVLRTEHKAAHVVTFDDHVEILTPPGDPFFDHRRERWRITEDGFIELYFFDRHYNVMHVFEHNNHDYAMYINLCLPARRERDLITWIDMDLDYRVGMDGRIELLDEEEYAANSRRLHYPESLKKKIVSVADTLPVHIRQGSFPFDYTTQEAKYTNWSARIGNRT